MQQGRGARSGRSDRPPRRNYRPQPGYPAEVEQPEGPQAFQPENPLPIHHSMPSMMLLNLMFTTYVQAPTSQEGYDRCYLLFRQYTKIHLPCTSEIRQRLEDNLFRHFIRCFERIYRQLLSDRPTETPTHLANLLTDPQVTHITQEQLFLLSGWQQVYIRQVITMSSSAAMQAPQQPPPPESPSPPVSQPQPDPPPPPPPFFPPQHRYSYPPPPPPPTSTPPLSDTRASTPEGPLDLSMSARPLPDYHDLVPNASTSDQPMFNRSQHLWTIIQENDDSPADEWHAQRSPARTISPPSDRTTDTPSDCFIVSSPEDFSYEDFSEQSSTSSYQFEASCSSADSRPLRSSEFTTSFGMASQTSQSPTYLSNYQPTTDRSLELHQSCSLQHTCGSLVGVSRTSKRGHSNDYAGVGISEPPPKRADERPSRRSVISFEPRFRANQHVPNPMHFLESQSLSDNEPSTSRSWAIKNEATKAQRSESHFMNVLNAPATSSYETSRRVFNEPSPAPSPVFTPGQMTWPNITHSSMSSLAHSSMSTPSSMPPPTLPPQMAKPPKKRRPPSMHIPSTSISPQTLPPQSSTFSPVHPAAHFSSCTPMYMPMHSTMHMPRLPPNYMSMPGPENIPLPQQRREPAGCPLCGVSTHSIHNCLLWAEHQRLRQQSRK